jgi:hypothetical protein
MRSTTSPNLKCFGSFCICSQQLREGIQLSRSFGMGIVTRFTRSAWWRLGIMSSLLQFPGEEGGIRGDSYGHVCILELYPFTGIGPLLTRRRVLHSSSFYLSFSTPIFKHTQIGIRPSGVGSPLSENTAVMYKIPVLLVALRSCRPDL